MKKRLIIELAIFGALAFGVKTGATAAVDVQITFALQKIQTPAVTKIMKAVSWPGYPPQTYAVYGLWVVAAGVIWGKRKGLTAAAGILGASLLGYTFKLILNRPRPDLPGIFIWHRGLEGGLRSFPAGHVQAFGVLGWLSAIWIVERWGKNKYTRAVKIIIFILVILMGVSRVMSGEHWATDVIAGYMIAAVIMEAIEMVNHWYEQKKY